MKLYDTGVYLLNGQKIVPENQADIPVSKEEAAKNTIAYSILEAHNTSGNPMISLLLVSSRQPVLQDLRSSRCHMF